MDIVIAKKGSFDTLAAQHILRTVLQKPDAVICFATGDTTKPIFEALIHMKNQLGVDFSRIHALNLDEYVGVAPSDPAGCCWRICQSLYMPLGLRGDQFYVPAAEDGDGEGACQRFRTVLKELGGIDLLLLSVGQNGHIAFNEPGTAFGLGVHLAPIADSTKNAKKELFGGIDKVPDAGISMGVADVMQARQILFVARGPHKAQIVHDALYGPVTEMVPASVLQLHPNTVALLDEDAAAKLKANGRNT